MRVVWMAITLGFMGMLTISPTLATTKVNTLKCPETITIEKNGKETLRFVAASYLPQLPSLGTAPAILCHYGFNQYGGYQVSVRLTCHMPFIEASVWRPKKLGRGLICEQPRGITPNNCGFVKSPSELCKAKNSGGVTTSPSL